MFNSLVVVAAMLLVGTKVVVAAVLPVGTKVDTGNTLCRDADELNTTDINMDELVNKRLNILFDSSPQALQINYAYGDIQVFDSANSIYTYDVTISFENLTTLSSKNILSYKNGIMKVTTYFSGGLSLNYNLTWYLLAQTEENAMLIYYCPHFPLDLEVDLRVIGVPSNNTLDEVATYRQVPVNYVLSKQSLDKLLAVDASYNFTGQMRMLPYALQEI